MSDSMSFLAGVSLAGIASLLLLKGVVPTTPSVAVPSPPTVLVPPPPPKESEKPPDDLEKLKLQLEQLKTENEKLKLQVDAQQKVATEQLKTQLQNQQSIIDALSAQTKSNAIKSELVPAVDQSSNSLQWGLVWGLGGAALTLGGGVVLAGLYGLMTRPQARSHRDIEVFHALDSPPTYLHPPRRRYRYLPAQREIRRTHATEER